jgi:putative membrane protein
MGATPVEPRIMRGPEQRLPSMRLILILLSLFAIACSALFGVLNGARIPVDFYFFQIGISTGVALLGALVVGWLLGGLVAWIGQVPRLRRELRATRVRVQELEAALAPSEAGGDP